MHTKVKRASLLFALLGAASALGLVGPRVPVASAAGHVSPHHADRPGRKPGALVVRERTHSVAPATGVLMGDTTVEWQHDLLSAGQAEAFQLTAATSGLAGAVHIYISGASAASTVVVGIYSSSSGHPGALLGTGSTSDAKAGAWATVTVAQTHLSAGRGYWLAILGEGGTLRYRDRSLGSCRSLTSTDHRLAALPASWRTAKTYSDCPLSAYVTPASAPQQGKSLTPSATTGADAPLIHEVPAPLVEVPVNIVLPAVSGMLQPGEVISVSTGSWSGSPTSYGYQWEDCDSSGAECSHISGATSSTYTLAEADLGKTIRGVVMAANTAGASPASSAQTATVSYAAPVNSALPVISGVAKEGSTLTSTTGTWTGGGIAYGYQWRQCNGSGEACSNISGATASSYTTVAGDAAHTIRVVVTATNTGAAVQATSAQTAVIGGGAPANTVLPAVTGTAQQGQTLTTTNGTWSDSPTGYTYQWQDCNTSGAECSAISGATSATYKAVESDGGKTIRVQVTATNSSGSTAASSEKTATVTYAPAVNTVLPVISGTAHEGKTLTTTNGSWTGSGLSYNYIWLRCNTAGAECAAIAGAAASSYVLQAADVGYTIKIIVGAANTGGSSQATSEKTATVLVAAPALAVLPVVSGTYQQGEMLSSTKGTWTGTGITYTYQWYRCSSTGTECSAISGANATTYKLLATEVGHTLEFGVFAENAGGNSSFATSPTGIVTGPVSEFATLTASSEPTAIVTGPEGSLWFTESNANKIGRVTPSGVMTEFSAGITASADPYGITLGPDGNLWFTEYLGSRIGRITPAGVVTEFSSGLSAGSVPTSIVKGNDGNLWFTESQGNRIGRITTSGVVTEFSTGITAGSQPYGITAGADGNLWFTESGGARIGRITTAGVITEFSTGITASSEPLGIAAGSDGNLWFTENQGQRIGRITTAGVVTEFSTGITEGSYPTAIVPGANGNLYFTERFGNRIGQVTTAGVISEFSAGITSEGRPLGIAAGPDGNLWFTEQNGSRIGRFSIGGPVNTVAPTVTGSAQHGQTLTLSTGSWTGSPTPSYSYIWQRCNTSGLACATISGATASTYLQVEADIGKTIRGVVTATSTLGAAPAPSTQTATVT